MTQIKLAKKSDLDALRNSMLQTVSPGTFLVSGGSVAFAGGRGFTVAAATYVIAGAQYTSPQTTVTLGAGDATNPRFDAIVADTAGTVSVIAGVAASNPSFPDIDQNLYLVLNYVYVPATATSIEVAVTNIYLENTEWTSAVSGATINAASASNPYAGTTDVEATAAAANDYVRFTNGAGQISLASQRQLVFYLRSKAAWPKQKSLQVAFFASGVKVGQAVSITDGAYGFSSSSTAAYQQIVIPITAFGIPSTSLVDRIQFTVIGSGGTIGWYLDNVFLEGESTAVPQPVITALQAQVDSLRIRTLLFPIDGGGAVITTGIKGDLPLDFSGTILGWRLYSDVAGSIQIDLWKASDANYPPTVANTITAAAKPTLASAAKNRSSTLTGWTTSFNADDVLRINVDSATTVTRATLALKVQVA